MLPREKRLTKNRDFERVYQKGKRLNGESFNLIFLKKNTGPTRVGIVVGKKFSKKATDRNRQKRIYKEAVADLCRTLEDGLDLVIFLKKTNKDSQNKTEAEKSLVEAFIKAGVKK